MRGRIILPLEDNLKRTIFAAALSFMAAAAAFSMEIEKPFFSGTTGFFASIASNKDKDSFDAECNAESYFAGLFDFSGKLFLRGEFYITSDSLFEDEVSEKNAVFRIEEISATYKAIGDSGSHYFSLFKGNYEPFGSDIFLQRQFGIAKINSNLTESYHGIEGASIFPLYTTGISYTYHSDGNKAISLSLHKNQKYRNERKNKDALNFDFRFAGLYDYATIDSIAGLVFPKGGDDDNSILNIDEVLFQAGINALFGHKKSFMLHTQFGVDGLYIKKNDYSDDSINMKNFHILIEPRIPVSDYYFNPSAFNFPVKTAADMVYLRPFVIKHPEEENVLGINFNLANENLYIGSSKVTAGIHGTIIMTEIDNDNLLDHPITTINDSEKTFILTTYANMEVFGGNITASISVDTKEIKDTPSKSISGTIGFRTNF